MEPFRRIGIIGLGLIGGSMAKTVKAQGLFVATVRSKSPDVAKAKRAKVVDQVYPSLETLMSEVDLLILATPLATILPIAEEIAKTPLEHPLLVIDVGSVKGDIVKRFEKLSRKGLEFFSTHPMAGSEKAGFDASVANIFQGAAWILVPHKKNRSGAKLARWIRSLGAKPLRMGPEEHDRKTALISHLPGALSAALWEFVCKKDKSSLKIAAGGFRSMTRLAHSNPLMRSQIAHMNRRNLDKLWEEFIKFLDIRGAFPYN